jgi:hypothetical protein
MNFNAFENIKFYNLEKNCIIFAYCLQNQKLDTIHGEKKIVVCNV